MADRAAWVRGLVEKRWQHRLAHVRAIAEEAATSALPAEQALGERLLAALDGVESPTMVAVRRADLDLVMNGAGDATRMAGWAAACQRIRDTLNGTHGQNGGTHHA